MKKSEYKIIFSPAALNDMKDAADWYNAQQKGLGKRFRADIKATIAAIILKSILRLNKI